MKRNIIIALTCVLAMMVRNAFSQESAAVPEIVATHNSAAATVTIDSEPALTPSISPLDYSNIVGSISEEGRIEFEKIPQRILDSFRKAAFEDELLIGEPLMRDISDEPAHQEAWQGNRPVVRAEINRALLRFRIPKELESEEGGQVPTFDIIVEFLPGEVIVRTSRPYDPRLGNGVKIAARSDRQAKILLRGIDRTSIAVLAPRVAIGEQDLQGVMLCPRYAYRKGTRKPELRDSGYYVARTMYAVDAKVQGRALTAGEVGYAAAKILTTPNVARSVSSFDETYLRDPSISLNYVAVTKEPLREDANPTSSVAGIQAEVILQRPAGFKRHTLVRDVVWMHKVMLSQEQAWDAYIDIKLRDATVLPGPCYLVVKERLLENRYSKESFKLPERLQPEGAAAAGPMKEG